MAAPFDSGRSHTLFCVGCCFYRAQSACFSRGCHFVEDVRQLPGLNVFLNIHNALLIVDKADLAVGGGVPLSQSALRKPQLSDYCGGRCIKQEFSTL